MEGRGAAAAGTARTAEKNFPTPARRRSLASSGPVTACDRSVGRFRPWGWPFFASASAFAASSINAASRCARASARVTRFLSVVAVTASRGSVRAEPEGFGLTAAARCAAARCAAKTARSAGRTYAKRYLRRRTLRRETEDRRMVLRARWTC